MSTQPLTHENLELASTPDSEEDCLGGIIQKPSLKYIPLEERRREAKKPLYLVRYE